MSNVSEKKLKYKSFFQNLIDTLRERGFTNARKGQPQGWYNFSIGYGARAQFAVAFKEKGKVGVEIYMDSDMDSNKSLFDQLMDRKNSIESELGESLEWERLGDKKASRIVIRRQGSIDDDQETLEEIEKWIIAKLFDFKRVFGPHLDELAK